MLVRLDPISLYDWIVYFIISELKKRRSAKNMARKTYWECGIVARVVAGRWKVEETMSAGSSLKAILVMKPATEAKRPDMTG